MGQHLGAAEPEARGRSARSQRPTVAASFNGGIGRRLIRENEAMRVVLSLRGDYAVRAMLALAAHDGDGWLSASRIAERMSIPVRFLPHVLTDLSRAGLVVGRQGRTGGYRLALPAERINLLRIVEAVEDANEPPRCVLRGGPCGADGRCAVHDAFAGATDGLRAELERWDLAELSRRGGARLVV